VIVVDTNVVVISLIEGPQTKLARSVFARDSDWRLPELWRHEFLNVLTTYVRHGGMELETARQLWLQAERLLTDCTQAVNMTYALKLSIEHQISAYDAQFVSLADELRVPFVTEDRRLLAKFPRVATSMSLFSTRGKG
jgi:predicted nucleic acid-binding protein